jgi:ribosomal protein S18 acetylase RimI-like enzyme
VIGELTAGQYERAVALWHQVGLTRPWNDPMADLLRAVEGPASTVLAAGDLDGTVMVGNDGHRAWMYYLAVDPAQQGRGLGRALVSAAEQWAAGRGAPKLMLMVRTSNTAVAGFYEAQGYTVDEVATLGKRL